MKLFTRKKSEVHPAIEYSYRVSPDGDVVETIPYAASPKDVARLRERALADRTESCRSDELETTRFGDAFHRYTNIYTGYTRVGRPIDNNDGAE